MTQAAYGLIWEEWRCTRKLCIMSAVLLASFAVVPWYFGRVGPWPAERLYPVLSNGLLGMFIIYLTMAHSTKNNIQAGIPRRRFLLPVGTFALVFWPLAYRLTLVAVLTSLVSVLAIGLFDSNLPHLKINCCVIAGAALVHMLAWSARLTGKLVTAGGFFLLLFPGVVWMVRLMDARLLPYPWVELLLPAAAVVVTLVVTTFTLSMLRSGGWDLVLPPTRSPALAAAPAQTDHRPFSTMLSAQIWYEWRSLGRKMTLIISCPVCALVSMPLSTSNAPITWRDFSFAFTVMIMICVPAGLWAMLRNDTNARRDSGRFAHTRCVNDSLLAWAKLGSSAATLFGSFVLLTVFLALIVFVKLLFGIEFVAVPEGLRPLLPQGGVAAFVTLAGMWIAAAILALAGMWIAYMRGGFVIIVAVVVNIIYGVGQGVWPETHAYLWGTASELAAPRMLYLVALVCGLMCLASFALPLRRKVIFGRTLMVLAIVWGIATLLGGTVTGFLVGKFQEVNLQACFCVWAALTLLAITPYATTSLQVHRLRHR